MEEGDTLIGTHHRTGELFGIVDGKYEALDAKNYEVMQFTGLHDKNGKEIWEGDIVKADDKVLGSIVFHNGAFKWTDGAAHWQLQDWANDRTITTCKWAQVIGNRFENPELLATPTN